MSNTIELAGYIISNNDSILLLKRIKTSWYELPGGKVEKNESVAEAAIREVKEELGCDVRILEEVGSKEFEENSDRFKYTWFKAEIIDGQIPEVVEAEKFSGYKYIKVSELEKHLLSPNMKNLLKEIQNSSIKI